MPTPATLVCTLRARTGPHLARFVSAWQVRYHTKVIRFEGFVSADLLSPVSPESNDWRLIVRFRTQPQLDLWRTSPEHAWLTAEAHELLDENAVFQETIGPEAEHQQPPHSVTEIIRSEILPGMEDAYRAWTQKTQHTQSQFPGYRGVHVIAPIPGQSNEWTTLLRFDNLDNLDRWRHSSERATLLEEARLVIQRTEITRLDSPFPGWVPLDPTTGANPPKWKTGLLVLLGLYPVVILTIRFITPHLTALNPTLAILLGNLLTVTATTYLTVPFLVQRFAWWLFPNPKSPPQTQLKGLTLILLLIIIQITLFWGLM
ncbi:hypothetical protein FEM03_02040 [Phragmitibacter flavus]|uniref:ABM domain-containing protein n=1 Tax=Phragmitibacter flavus TaxID=2576071 RepID=A0A5R8KKM1_9BACT|nr:antibiotic biosynthesis monooxygenase [Phragmitibacter flavus]TLD72159.1 hypothetical protein FEM03_02040 [Phragmitibacter flavus]